MEDVDSPRKMASCLGEIRTRYPSGREEVRAESKHRHQARLNEGQQSLPGR